MDYLHMTAPCGLDCFNCTFFLAPTNPEAQAQVESWSKEFGIPLSIMTCKGCRDEDGKIPILLHLHGESHRCAAYECAKQKGNQLCGDCDDFPCDNLHPYADNASQVPHNTKVFNLCLINKMGIDKWAESKAADVRRVYFTEPWKLT